MALRIARLEHQHTRWLTDRLRATPARTSTSSPCSKSPAQPIGFPAGTLYGIFDSDRPVAAYWVGGNIIPVAANRGRTRCSPANSMPTDACLLTHRQPVRHPRPAQRLIGASRAGCVNGSRCAISPTRWSPRRTWHFGDLDEPRPVFPASVDMFTKEVGFSLIEDGTAGYLSRVRGIIRGKNCYARISSTLPQGGPVPRWPATEQDEQVLFKADIGIRARRIVQVQGVWVHPEVRNQGLGAAGMAAVVQRTRDKGHSTVSLYANDYNETALRMYARVGFDRSAPSLPSCTEPRRILSRQRISRGDCVTGAWPYRRGTSPSPDGPSSSDVPILCHAWERTRAAQGRAGE